MGMMHFFSRKWDQQILLKKRMERRGHSTKSKNWKKRKCSEPGKNSILQWMALRRLRKTPRVRWVHLHGQTARVREENDFERLGRTQDLQWQMQEQTDLQTEPQTPAEVGAHHSAQAWDRVLQSRSCCTQMAEKGRAEKSWTPLISSLRKSTCQHYIRRWSALDGEGQRHSWRYLSLQDTAKEADAFLQPQSNTQYSCRSLSIVYP